MLHIKWCKVRAWAKRWSEEILLLLEEMRCVIVYRVWHADWWEELAFVKTDLSLAIGGDCKHLWRNVVAYINRTKNVTQL